MSMSFNADMVLEIAEQIERNGAKFYRAAAQNAAGEEAAQLLLDLARWEAQHERTFAAMRKELAAEERKPTVFDPGNELTAYLHAFADGRVFNLKQDLAGALSGDETIEEVLQMALGREKDTIVFFLGISEMVGESLGQGKIDAIIKEEMTHVTMLSRQLGVPSA